MKRQIIIRNPLNDLSERWDCWYQKFRFSLISFLFTKYEKEQILVMFDEALDVINKDEKDSHYKLLISKRYLSIDILKYKLKSSW